MAYVVKYWKDVKGMYDSPYYSTLEQAEQFVEKEVLTNPVVYMYQIEEVKTVKTVRIRKGVHED